MNKSMVRFLLSKLLLIEAALLLVPLIVAFIYQESLTIIFSILTTMAILILLGSIGIIFKPKNYHIYTKEGLLIVALCWVLWSFFGALPFIFTGQIPNIIDAFFEVSSGFTTTGATILPDVSVLSHSLLFWRSFTHLIGGMGVLVFALAIMENSKNSHLEVMRAEVPGPVFGKVVSKLKNTAQILYIIYLIMFAVFAIILWGVGMPLYDSLVTAMGTAGTGGFTVFNDGIAHYHSSLIINLVSIGMLLFGVNFNLYYLLLIRKFKTFFGDEELRTYIGIALLATLLIWLNVGGQFATAKEGLEISFFQVSTTMTTTGFGITNLTTWPLFSQFILLLLMFLGGSAGSTAGGFKVMRVLILSKIAKNQVLSSLYPNRVISLHINQQSLDKRTQHSVLKYLAIYLLIFISLVLILTLDNNNLMIVTSAAASAFNNIGPILGTDKTFAIFSPFSKLVLSFAMIAGRLEIYPMLLLFIPKTWSKT
ncbi:TrkH family potassium uptake protein [Streptococcus mutans]|uniref:TrkH family potassium uptake protein n=1 Tax=Streptococcus mutans TaxID=1309 RepID=UPI00232C8768|nr:TrkH family potassium uptake protein [Streptococcus mutans]MDB8635685.1 TrkH family potassium uptake protein [Streptococcus mutans]MDB8637991.1 TrkH family potassium uptake protein [Streptococcus mutans]MDB8640567.1 TrkH family potassium uptake protein [Streptococcus mutans]